MIAALTGRFHKCGTPPFEEKITVSSNFVRRLDEIGCEIFPILSENNVDIAVGLCDFLIIPGSGKHIDPKYYGEDRDPDIDYTIDEYALDRQAIAAFANAGKPILGICGGTLDRHVEGHSPVSP